MPIPIDIDELIPLIRTVTYETYLCCEQRRNQLEQLVYTEAEAAAVLRLNKRQLAGERDKERIKASRIVGRQIRYSRHDILEYLLRNRINDPEHPPLDGDSAGKSRLLSKKRKVPPVSSPTTSANDVRSKPLVEEEAAVDRESMSPGS